MQVLHETTQQTHGEDLGAAAPETAADGSAATPETVSVRAAGRIGPRLAAWRVALMPLAVWYGRRELPRAWGVLSRWGMTAHEAWAGLPVVEMRDRFHGYRVRLDLADYFQRIAWFFGCYHERQIVTTLTRALRAGDAFVDGGANTGLLTLHAAGLVGAGGRIDAFEPCEAVLQDLRWHVAANALAQVRVHAVGLSDRDETLELRIPGIGNMAAGTLGPLPERYGGAYHDACGVRTVRLDGVLAADDDRPLLIKLDVEGFELRALLGGMETIARRKPAILMETNDEMLNVNGTNPQALDAALRPLGYQAFALDRRGWRHGYRLHLHPLKPEQISHELDALWLSPDGPHWARFERSIQPAGAYWRHRSGASS